MPLYRYHCASCNTQREEVKSVETRLDVFCCGERATKLIDAVFIGQGVSFKEYLSPVTERLISSPTSERDELARTGCIISEPGVREDIARNREAVREATFKPIHKTIESRVTAMEI